LWNDSFVFRLCVITNNGHDSYAEGNPSRLSISFLLVVAAVVTLTAQLSTVVVLVAVVIVRQ
jgi:hypothetical protein